jgi:BirA family transcriptional regulator, biotin operon repressor / biotin---[acetyl-CoA-carboxylase] ligase
MSELQRQRIEAGLTTRRYGRSLSLLESTASTNDDAKRAIEEDVVAGHVIVADRQLAGRGSRGRVWESPAGSDLYLSVVDRLPVALAELPPLTLAVGLGVAEAIDRALALPDPERTEVKWPNDVWLGGKKCAGVLIETSVMTMSANEPGAVVIGIGLNVNRATFPEALQPSATSLRLHADAALDRNRVLCQLLDAVERRVDQFVAEGAAAIVAALGPRLALRDCAARCDALEGVVRGVDASGALLFETAGTLRPLIAGRLERLA